MPSPDHPAEWLTAGDLVVGDTVITGGTKCVVTGIIARHDGRYAVMVQGSDRPLYPHAKHSQPVLVWR